MSSCALKICYRFPQVILVWVSSSWVHKNGFFHPDLGIGVAHLQQLSHISFLTKLLWVCWLLHFLVCCLFFVSVAYSRWMALPCLWACCWCGTHHWESMGAPLLTSPSSRGSLLGVWAPSGRRAFGGCTKNSFLNTPIISYLFHNGI